MIIFITFCIAFILGIVITIFISSKFNNSELKNISIALDNLSSNNFNINLNPKAYNKLISKMVTHINQIKKNTLVNIFENQAVSSQITSVSHQLNLTIEDTIKNSNILAQESNELSQLNNESYNQIKATVSEIKNILELFKTIKRASSEISYTSADSKNTISDGLIKILGIVDAVKEIKSSTDNTVSNITELKGISNEINSILDTVSSISNQTQLLSLNASIEAARAGELGKGFNVVAEEIQKLALESQNSVIEISRLVDKIGNQIEIVFSALKPTQSSVLKSVQYSESIEGVLTEIKHSFENVLELTDEVAKVVDNESHLIEQVGEDFTTMEISFDKINEGVKSVSSTVNVQKESITDLTTMKGFLINTSKIMEKYSEKVQSSLNTSTKDITNQSENILNLLEGELLSKYLLLDLTESNHKKILDDFFSKHQFIEAIWTNDTKGKFIYSNPAAGIANASMRDWFNESIKGKAFTSSVYISSITSNPCVTVSMPIKDYENEIIGVLGADIKIEI